MDISDEKNEKLDVNEELDSPDFIKRIKRRNKKKCADPDKFYEWAEFKSSLFANQIIKNEDTMKKLTLFLKEIAIGIWGDTYIDTIMDLYLLGGEEGKKNYPIGGYIDNLWNNPGKNRDMFYTNFFGMYNFLSWSWSLLRTGHITGNKKSFKTFIDNIQQKVSFFHQLIRGKRKDDRSEIANDNEIGITNIYSDHLIPEGLYSNKNKSWDHPGRGRCQVTYRGQYGSFIKNCRDQNLDCGSLQCGISGSTQYITFLYLMSKHSTFSFFDKESTRFDEDIHNIILSAIIIL